jgi:hypothetical protein
VFYSSHSLAIDANGGLWAWGYNWGGQLGDGTTENRSSPVKIKSGTHFASVSAGYDHSLAIDDDGGLWAWGSNGRGQLGNGTSGWDENKNEPIKIKDGTRFLSITAGGASMMSVIPVGHSLAIDENGGLWAWGTNWGGHLGDGTDIQRNSPVKIKDCTRFTSVSAGGEHSLAIDEASGLWAWGNNWSGHLGDGTTTSRYRPVQIWKAPLYGDVNGDGVINSGDVTFLKYYIASSDRAAFIRDNPSFNLVNARITGFGADGDENTGPSAADVSLLQLWIATPAPDRHMVQMGPRVVIQLEPQYAILRVRGLIQLTATVHTESPSVSTRVIWESSDRRVARVTSEGLVVGIRPGKATITAKSAANHAIVKECEISVFDEFPHNVHVDLFAEQIWRNHHDSPGNPWESEALGIFTRAMVPFLFEWNIRLIPHTGTIQLDGINCNYRIPGFPGTPTHPSWICQAACGDISLCHDAQRGHHRSAARATNTTFERSTRTLSISIIGYGLCWLCPRTNHSQCHGCDEHGHGRVNGMARLHSNPNVSRGAITSGYLDIEDEIERFWRTIRTMQHEFSHNYGTIDESDKPQRCPTECIMQPSGFRTFYEDRGNIWCIDCKLDFRPNKF